MEEYSAGTEGTFEQRGNVQRNTPYENVFEDSHQSPVVDQAETQTKAEERQNESHRVEVREGPVNTTRYGRASKLPNRLILVIGFITKEYQCIVIQVYNIV